MMVAWYWLILAFCAGIAFATITDEWCEWENTLTDVLAWIAYDYRLRSFGFLLHISQTNGFPPHNA